MTTNRKTLSPSLITPTLTNFCIINTAITGWRINRPNASAQIATNGKSRPLRGIFNLANDDPIHTRPSGTDALPRKVAVSRRKLSGGAPSGAKGITGVPSSCVSGTKRALRGGILEIIKETMIVIVNGPGRVRRNLLKREARVGLDTMGDDQKLSLPSSV